MICRAKLFRLAWSTARSMSLFNKTSPRREFAYALKLAWKEMKKRAGLEAMYARQTAEKVAADRAALLEARERAQPHWDAQDAAAIAMDSDNAKGEEFYRDHVMSAIQRISEIPSRTPAGLAVKLRYLFTAYGELSEYHDAAWHNTEPDDECLSDARDRLLWNMVGEAERMAAPSNDQRRDADAFADTVAAFEAEAPATLALPQEPTGRMVDAGASAAGITPAQFQAAYAAAVEALKLERAA